MYNVIMILSFDSSHHYGNRDMIYLFIDKLEKKNLKRNQNHMNEFNDHVVTISLLFF